MCEWASMMPGETNWPVVSTISAPAGTVTFAPTAAILPSFRRYCSVWNGSVDDRQHGPASKRHEARLRRWTLSADSSDRNQDQERAQYQKPDPRMSAGHEKPPSQPGGFAPPDPPAPSLAGAPRPAPLRRRACGATSPSTRGLRPVRLRAKRSGETSPSTRGLRPAGPPSAVARGGPTPRSAPAARLRRDLTFDQRASPAACARSAPETSPSTFAPPDPPAPRSRGPHAPLRSGGAPAARPHLRPEGFAPPDPPAPSLAGAPRPAPLRRRDLTFHQRASPRPPAREALRRDLAVASATAGWTPQGAGLPFSRAARILGGRWRRQDAEGARSNNHVGPSSTDDRLICIL